MMLSTLVDFCVRPSVSCQSRTAAPVGEVGSAWAAARTASILARSLEIFCNAVALVWTAATLPRCAAASSYAVLKVSPAATPWLDRIVP